MLRQPLIETNTPLHDLIASNQTENALALLQLDEKLDINAKSLGNTPLMLALKKGNMALANALLAHPDINVTQKDDRGLTPLHWACMLRQDALIEKLLQKSADPHSVAPMWAENMEEAVDANTGEAQTLTPLNLYQRHVLSINFFTYHQFYLALFNPLKSRNAIANFYAFHNLSLIYNDKDFNYRVSPFVDSPCLQLPGDMAYTDLMFHMRDVCKNLWPQSADKLKFRDDFNVSHAQFHSDFGTGLAFFCQMRNSIPVNPVLLDRMKNITISAEPIRKKSETIPTVTELKLDPIINHSVDAKQQHNNIDSNWQTIVTLINDNAYWKSKVRFNLWALLPGTKNIVPKVIKQMQIELQNNCSQDKETLFKNLQNIARNRPLTRGFFCINTRSTATQNLIDQFKQAHDYTQLSQELLTLNRR